MIIKDNKEISSINAKGKEIVSVLKGGRLVWQSVRSCFGAGYWVNEKPWINEEGWRNNTKNI